VSLGLLLLFLSKIPDILGLWVCYTCSIETGDKIIAIVDDTGGNFHTRITVKNQQFGEFETQLALIGQKSAAMIHT
jgi:hypothetical protein